ncbi:hypothetical protein Ndes2526A_g00468 [Nannochloris sp. 'desiccata']
MALINSTVLPAKSFKMQRAGLNAVNQRGSRLICCSSSVIEQVRQNVASKSVRAQDLVQQYIEQAEARNADLNSFISIDRDGAMLQAAQVDERIKNGELVGPLTGVPIAVKDNICTLGLQTTAGSKILDGYKSPYDATAVAKLRAAGAIIIGKTNMDEFGMGSSTESSGYGPTLNPWGKDRVPGGSSGGSASAVAAGQCAAALGSDTGGSIRQPANFCGIVGVKPTYGRVSRCGLISYASSLDCIGPMARSVADAAAVLEVISGADPMDATSSTLSVDNLTEKLVPASYFSSNKPLAGRKFGFIRETSGEGVAPEVEASVRAAATQLESLGAAVEEISLPTYKLGLPAYYVIALSEASSNLSRYDGVRYGLRAPGTEDLREMYAASRTILGGEVRRRIIMGTYALSAGYYDAYYKRAQQVRTLIAREMSAALNSCDALICPVAPTPAYKVGEKTTDPLAMYKGDLMTVNVNLAGLPAVVLPCGVVSDGGESLPVGLQMIGKAFGEADLLYLAHVYEQTAGVAEKTQPPGFPWL